MIRISILLLFSVLLNANQAEASRIKRGNKALLIHDYFKAKKLLTKGLKYNASPASFGLATIYSRSNNPFYNLDSAYRFINLANSTWGDTKFRKKDKWKIYGWTQSGIDSLKLLISSQFYQVAIDSNKIETYSVFLNMHPNSLEYEKVLHVRDSMAFFKAIHINSAGSYQGFMSTYPKSEYCKLAEQNFLNSQFQEHTLNRSLESFTSFVEEFPDSPQREEADRAIFEIVTADNSVESYARFTKNYPENTFVDLGWSRFYQLYISNYSIDKIQAFKENYQSASNQDEIYSDLSLMNSMFLPFLKNDKMGLMNVKGEEVFSADFEHVGAFEHGLAIYMSNDKAGMINKRGEKQIGAFYDGISPIENGRFIVEKNDLLGLIDRNGKELLPCVYEDIIALSKNRLFIVLEDSTSIVDYNGNKMSEVQFKEIEPFYNNLAIAQTSKGSGVIDSSFNFILEDKFNGLKLLNDTLFSFEMDEKLGILNLKGDTILQPRYTYIGSFINGLALASSEDTVDYITTTGEIGINRFFQTYSNYKVNGEFLNGNAIVFVGGEFGRVDKEGVFVTSPDYENIGRSEKLVPFQTEELWGSMNQSNKLIISPMYQSLDVISENYVLTKLDNAFGIVDLFGNKVIDNSFISITHLQGDAFVVSDGIQYSLFIKGEQVTSVGYNAIRNFKNGFVSLVNNEGISYFDIEKNTIIKLK